MGTSWSTVIDDRITGDDGSSWCNPTTPSLSSTIGVANAVEDLLINPEDMDLEPEEIQGDDSGWIKLPDPT